MEQVIFSSEVILAFLNEVTLGYKPNNAPWITGPGFFISCRSVNSGRGKAIFEPGICPSLKIPSLLLLHPIKLYQLLQKKHILPVI